ncbi:MAG: histidinol-phosphate transaminase [Cytophagales bacterium]|nr:histidinol-phosphate transaminase [Cytophagales bacterium]
MSVSRRKWLKGIGLTGAATLFGPALLGNDLSETEIKRFRPRPMEDLIRLSSNENPYGPSDRVRKAMIKAFDIGCRYPGSYSLKLHEMIAEKEGVTTDHICITGGSTEGLKVVGLTYGKDGGEIIAAKPTFLAMMTYAKQWGGKVNWVPVDDQMMHDTDEMEKRISSKTKLLFLCNPNNPTSTLLPADVLRDFCETASQKTMVFSDEAYYDFIDDPNYPSMVELVKQDKNVIVSKTFSKVYGLAGLRIGYMVAKPEIVKKMRTNLMAFTNMMAIAAAEEAIRDQEFYEFSLKKTQEGKKMIYETLDQLGLEYAPSQTNFIFFKSGVPITDLQSKMKAQGVLIGRPFPPFDRWCRISTGTIEEVQRFNQALTKVLG